MDERAEWEASINRADTIELKVMRARTYLAKLHSDAAHGGPDCKDEIAEVRRKIAEWQQG